MEIFQALMTQTICVLFSSTILWLALKLFDREINYLALLCLNSAITVIATIGLMISESFLSVIVIYFVVTVIFYWGLMKYSNIRSLLGCFIIVIAASAMETAVGKGLDVVLNKFL